MIANISMNYSRSSPSPCPYPPDNPRTFYSNDFIMTFIVINAVLALVSSCNNFVVIYTIGRTPSIQVPSNILVMGLAISDFAVGVFVQPAYCIFKYFDMKRSASLFCTFFSIYIYSIWTFATVSLLTLTAITADRFLAVHLHLRYQELVTTRRYGILLGCIWVVSTLISICRMQLKHLSFVGILGVLTFVLIITLNLYFLIKIFQVIRRHSVQIQAQQQSIQQSIDMPRYKKSVNTMYYVIGAFLLCYVPYVGTMVVDSDANKKMTQHYLVLSFFTETLVMFNGVLNPIIYCWRIRDMRQAAFELFRKYFSNV